MPRKMLSIGISLLLALFLIIGFLASADTTDGQELPELRAIAWSNDGTLLALGYRNGNLEIKNAQTQQTISIRSVDGLISITSITWKPDNSQIIVSGDTVQPIEFVISHYSSAFVLNMPSMEVSGILPGVSTAGGAIAAWSQDSSQIITSGFDIGVIIWDATTYTHLPDYFPAVTIAQLKWTEDRSMLAIAATAASLVVDGDDYSRVFTSTRPESAPPITVGAIAFSPTKQQLISGDGAGDIRVWDTASRNLINTLVATENPSSIYGGRSTVDVAFNPTEIVFHSVTRDGTLRTWDSVTLSLLDSVVLPGAPINRAAFSPDGSQLAYSGQNGSLEVIPLPSIENEGN